MPNGAGFLSFYKLPKRNLHDAFEFLFEDIQPLPDIFKIFAPSENDLSWREDKSYDLGIFDPVYKPGELFGFVLDILDIERDNYLVEIDVLTEIVWTDHVSDRDSRLF